ncbi:guanine nucleotide-binding protein subunit alpha-11 [Stomoxys calcitrans]|uniref:Guanine nucleotide-binding protein subunit alpha n=1 Tax=Stomoxys calcitrans TaxID=35570 RepID=A0A1I8Q557_STOCA|nr:guanine nucleotide-binding protein subunit alpha-11 [Stomoxys calcitrans]
MDCCLDCFLPEVERQKRIISKQIDEEIEKKKRQEKNQIKLLLLGTGESGKSTFIRQMRIIYDKGFTDEDSKGFIPTIMQNILESMKTMIGAMSYFNIDYELHSNIRNSQVIKNADNEKFASLIDMYLTAIKELWSDAGIQECFLRRSEYQLMDSIKYYLENIDRIALRGYIPTQDDILHARAATSGLVEYKFKIQNVDFLMVDVGGQRSERKRWLNCFDKVQAIIFLTAISEYDQVLMESDQLNRLVESRNVFHKILTYEWFIKTSIVLFFNKIDLLEEKIMYSDLDKYFPEFQGPKHDYEAAKQFIAGMFDDAMSNRKNKYPHFTCATDTNNIKFVFDAVRDSILNDKLDKFGLF